MFSYIRNFALAAALLVLSLGAPVFGPAPAQAAISYSGVAIIAGNVVTYDLSVTTTGNTATFGLTNTSPANTLESPTSTITGFVFDNLLGMNVIGAQVITTGPTTLLNLPTGTDVTGEFGGGVMGSQYVFGSAGYVPGGQPNFGGISYSPPTALNGVNFGAISLLAGPLNGGLSGEPLITNGFNATLTFSGAVTEDMFTGIAVVTGTRWGEGYITAFQNTPPQRAPEPGALALFGIALFGLGLVHQRRKRGSSPSPI